MRRIAGMRVLLTGAAGGIGSAAARRLAAGGARLILIDTEAERLEALAADLDDALTYPVDITDLPALERVVDDATARFGGLDTVVANAADDVIGPLGELTAESFDRCVQVNVMGTWRTMRAALPAMSRGGYFLVVSSGGIVVPPPFQGPYTASKAAVGALADTLRVELRSSGIRVGVIFFGSVDTEHARRSLGHPLMQRALRRFPESFIRLAPAEGAAEAIERAILQRSRTAVYPRSSAPLMHLPGVVRRAMERWFTP